jgi:hypothetical protein
MKHQVFVLMPLALLVAGATLADAPPGRYEIDANQGTVTDRLTGLVWQREVHTYAWQDAKRYCANQSPAEAGWRLPSMKELQTIVDESQSNPAIDNRAFPDTPPAWFWSSSAAAGSSNRAWSVDFHSGHTSESLLEFDSNQLRLYVRCVR